MMVSALAKMPCLPSFLVEFLKNQEAEPEHHGVESSFSQFLSVFDASDLLGYRNGCGSEGESGGRDTAAAFSACVGSGLPVDFAPLATL